jgi:glycine/D-amino acid oxidase-like deaminating enzyme/nitrite reductase/ring-hydroxylating ferredoxin subunit
MPNYANSVWTDDTDTAPRHPRLAGKLRVDVAIVGAGITGVTAAVLLKRAGKTVAIVEGLRVGKGETGKTTAHLTSILDERYHSLSDKFEPGGARAVHESQRAAIERIERFVHELAIDCELERLPGYLFTERADGVDAIEKEAAACRELGIPAALTSSVPLPFPVARALRFEDQGQFHPRKYLLALAATVPGAGSEIYEDSQVLEVEEGEPCRVITADGEVMADHVLVAAHVPITNRIFLHTKIAAYRSYVVGALLEGVGPAGLFWDTEDPYHYIRTHRLTEGGHVLIVGGEDHKVGQEPDTSAPFVRLEQYLRQRFGHLPIECRWSGQIIEPVDGLPYIGRNALSSRIHVATGYAGQGMTSGTLAAMILSDQVQGWKNPYSELYDATRIKPIAGAREFVRENVDFPAHLLRDRLQRDDHPAASLPVGEGAVLTIEGDRLAVYRNHAGELSAVSPVCTHLGCLVNWNTTEKSWDCPCHGSRFDPHGRVLNGPAVVGLQARKLPLTPVPVKVQEGDEAEQAMLPDLVPEQA